MTRLSIILFSAFVLGASWLLSYRGALHMIDDDMTKRESTNIANDNETNDTNDDGAIANSNNSSLFEKNKNNNLSAATSGDGMPVGSKDDNTTVSTTDEITTKTKPLFVLHIGPPKTGTSTIQGIAYKYQDLLRQDNVWYLGHWGRGHFEFKLHELSDFCRDCDDTKNCKNCLQRWNEFEDAVDKHYQQHHNVFVSDETFNRFFNKEQDAKKYLWTRLKKSILSRWNVKVVVTYRRYYEWLPSTYHQWFNPLGQYQLSKREEWPDKGGLTIPSFPQWFQSFTSSPDKHFKDPLYILQEWKQHFDHVHVMNMHQHGDFVSTFYCQELPNAKQLCNHLKSTAVIETKKMNPSTTKILRYDMMAVEAYQQGLLQHGNNMTRPQVTELIQQHAEHNLNLTSLNDFQLTCLSKQQTKTFLNMSLELETNMVPNSGDKTDLQRQFELAVKSHKFCSINAKATLLEERWKTFFSKLNKNNHI